MRDKKSIILNLIFTLLIIAIIFCTYYYIVYERNGSSNQNEQPVIYSDKDILYEYAKKYEETVNDYYNENNVIPSHDDIRYRIKYYKNIVKCNINDIYDDKSIYLNDCSINGKETNVSYGNKKSKVINGLLQNEYALDYDFKYVKRTSSFRAYNKQEILNVLYTIVNSGIDKYTFNCANNECIKEIENLISNNIELASINNFVHPFNSYKQIFVEQNNRKKVNIIVEKRYTKNEITYTNKMIDEIIANNINDNMSDKEKVRILHDYIINNSSYATDNIRNKNPNISYTTAYDILTTKYGLCMAYADFMSIALHKINIKNLEITSEEHEWNLVELDDKWYHLDATWDDPITPTNENYLQYTYFLITDNELTALNVDQHNYNKDIILELS